MIWLQKTLKGSATLEGVGLHTGRTAKMTLRPAPPNTGLVFTVPGEGGGTRIPALVDHAAAEDELNRATTLARNGVVISTVEHVLAALHGMGITNCEIELEGGEPPVTGCASARAYVEMIEGAGIQDQALPALSFKVVRPMFLKRGEVEITAEPADRFLLSFHVDYDDPAIGVQDATFEIRPDVFQREIAPARTFALMKDVARLQDMGLVKGGSLANNTSCRLTFCRRRPTQSRPAPPRGRAAGWGRSRPRRASPSSAPPASTAPAPPKPTPAGTSRLHSTQNDEF